MFTIVYLASGGGFEWQLKPTSLGAAIVGDLAVFGPWLCLGFLAGVLYATRRWPMLGTKKPARP